MVTISDEVFLANGVVFLPWVGEKYEVGFNARKLLVLGESHYDEWGGVSHSIDGYLTRNCVEEICDRKGGSTFWRYIEQALLNEPRVNGWTLDGGKPFWERIAFYNFVQEAVRGGPRARPSWDSFVKSRLPFRCALEQLRPDRVWVCGKQLWTRMEGIENSEDCLNDDVQPYRLRDGSQVWCLATVHPVSGGFSWKRLHPVLMAFLNDPRLAASMIAK